MKFATTEYLKTMFDNTEGGVYCIVQRMPVQAAFEHQDMHVREAAASYLKGVLIAMTGKEDDSYTCFVCEEAWSKRCAPHQFLLVETMTSTDVLVSAICSGCCNKPSTIIAALDACFDTKFMVMQEAGHA